METIEKLRKEIEEQRRRAEEAEGRALAAEGRALAAEGRARAAEDLALAEQRQREEAEKTVSPTDFRTFLSLCHNSLHAKMAIQEDSDLSATGIFTNVDNKYYPLCLKEWTDFPSLHDQCQDKLESLFKDQHVFPAISGFDVIDDIFPMDTPLADEDDVRLLQFIKVESCARRVLSQYLKESRVERSPPNNDTDQNENSQGSDDKTNTDLPIRVYFSNMPHGILVEGPEAIDENQQSDTKPAYKPVMLEAQEKDAKARGRTAGDGQPPAKRISTPARKFHPDQWFMRVNADGSIVPVFVVEYKAAHKLRGSTLKLAFSDTTREPYGLFAAAIREQMQNKIVQGDERLKKQTAAEKATARVLTQAFHYMVEFGLCYSYVASGEALVLLYMDAEDARTLYYHLALPREEVGSGAAEDVRRSAVSLVTTMALLALDGPVLSQRWKKKAVGVLEQWPTPYDEMQILDESSEEDNTRKLKDVPKLAPRRSQQGCKEATPQKNRQKDGDDDGNDRTFLPKRSLQSPTALAGRQYATRSKDASTTNTNNTSNTTRQCQPLPYCSQACILSLRNGGPLDRACPNVQRHPATEGGCHRLTAAQFCHQLREQLACDLDENCDALDKFRKFGAIGMLFRLTLQGYGYCVVAKGVQRVHASRLEQEMAVYTHLQEQQGTLVPVCLGIIQLVDVYRTSFGAHISHMMVMSYAGEPVGSKAAGKIPDNIVSLEYDAWARLRQLGVEHGDERGPNVLWNAAQQRLICIDFEWSKIIDRSKTAKRKRKYAKEERPGQQFPAWLDGGTPHKKFTV